MIRKHNKKLYSLQRNTVYTLTWAGSHTTQGLWENPSWVYAGYSFATISPFYKTRALRKHISICETLTFISTNTKQRQSSKAIPHTHIQRWILYSVVLDFIVISHPQLFISVKQCQALEGSEKRVPSAHPTPTPCLFSLYFQQEKFHLGETIFVI